MSTVKHTPGPWLPGICVVEKSGDGFAGIMVADRSIHIGLRSVAAVNFSSMNLAGRLPRDLPDFLLMLAAPELLAALVAMLPIMEDELACRLGSYCLNTSGVPDRSTLEVIDLAYVEPLEAAIAAAKAAIAKATGA